MEDRLILLGMAAEELGYSPERLRQMARKGEVKAERRGRLYLLRESEIQRLRDRGRLRAAKGSPRRPPASD